MSSDIKLLKARASLVVDQPFFASLLFSIPMTADSSIETIATNGAWIKYNPQFIDSLSQAETVFVLAHEVMHCVLEHSYRRESRDPKRWNVAADYVVNQALSDMPKGSWEGMPPKGCLFNQGLVSQYETTERVYASLPDNGGSGQSNQPGNKPGSSGDEPDDSGGLGNDIQDGQGEAPAIDKPAIARAVNAAKMAGMLPAGIARIAGEATKSKVNWREVLRNFLTQRAKTDLSYAKPKRRFLADDIFLPSLTGEKLGSIVIAVDCSGSILDSDIAAFSKEISAIREDVRPEETHVIYFDSIVSRHDKFSADDTFEIKPTGGGGTAFSPVFSHIEKDGIEPAAIVFLTDLCCSDFGNAPEAPVLWASTYGDRAPFGNVVKMES